ncbi:hypothetical protein BAUCODRAFT_61485 [Baudoinia panamericana UAMH 10762]|uniref:Ketoreductase domain-containing protein n=1 Tax=Baudoinia panamericana (strain UAMH 10762) TaxID=717646 RepID=M2NNG9_BAUPA|nr:uncharacterized protein BAUCODRAFT_61485 [Baudoinia panamericana UAMH 10762]EMD01040.1 hypothetical protein BAUCODRAFT_61485 [Baudoinia panamericana UAMH 10762]
MSSQPRSKSLEGKVALVTGSGRGIGAAIVTRFAEHGANVVVNYHSSADKAEKVAEHCRSLGVKAVTVKGDVSSPADIERLFETAAKELGGIDIVMSNSGIEHFNDLEQTKPVEIEKVFRTNVFGQYYVAQAAHKHMNKNGRLILISSISAQWGITRHAVYSASKAAIQGMVKCLAQDFGPKGITVNAVAPGGIKSDMWIETAKDYVPGGELMSDKDIDERISKMSPFNRPGYPEDIAGVVALLASPEAQWLTGQTLHAGGGAFMA